MFFPKALLFDLDGVLLDTEPLHGKAWKKTAASFGTNLNNTQLELLKGRRRKDCAQQISNWINQSIEIEEILKVHNPISKKLLKNSAAMPGAEDLVKWCCFNKLPISLITSSTSSSVFSKTASHNWLNSFSTRVHGDDPYLKSGKPAPDAYLLGAKKLKVDPKKCWAIEDSISGTESALLAGCHVWVLKTNPNKILSNEKIKDSNLKPEFINHLDNVLYMLKQYLNY